MDRGTWLGYSPWALKESDTTERLHSDLFKQDKEQDIFSYYPLMKVVY